MVTAVLVTGGAGYIGSHTCKALAASGFVPVTLDNLSAGHEWAVKWGPFVRGDLADRALIRDVIRDHNVEAVVHFAAHAYVGESMTAPGKYFQNNVTNALNLLDASVESGVRRLVFSSTCATYGHPDRLPITEDQPQCPINPYGESKLFVERALRWYEVAHGFRSVSLRYFNAAGADPDGEIGEAHEPETHLIPLIIQAAMGQRECLDIYGTDYDTPDGTAIRDYIHVTDLADAHVRALHYLRNDGGSVALNLGTGEGHSVTEVVDAVSRAAGAAVPTRLTDRRPGDPPVLVADATKATDTLQWCPHHSDLEQIVTSAWNWHHSWTDRAAASAASGRAG